jgi:hypothetical protein
VLFSLIDKTKKGQGYGGLAHFIRPFEDSVSKYRPDIGHLLDKSCDEIEVVLIIVE